MKCAKCSGKAEELQAKTPEGIIYKYYKCVECGEEIVNMKQLHEVAEKYRLLKKYSVKLTKWGESIGLRIPKELTKKYKLKPNEIIIIIPEEEGMKIIAE